MHLLFFGVEFQWCGKSLCSKKHLDDPLGQCFPNLSWRTPSPAHFVCLPYLTHLIPLISSLVETARHELGVSDKGLKGDIQNVQGRGSSRTGLGSTALGHIMDRQIKSGETCAQLQFVWHEPNTAFLITALYMLQAKHDSKASVNIVHSGVWIHHHVSSPNRINVENKLSKHVVPGVTHQDNSRHTSSW